MANEKPSAAQAAVSDAVATWARGVFGAPRRLHELVTNVEGRDEEIQRVVTHILRRDVLEASTSTRERRSTPPRLDQNTLDPFAYTTETLRAASEHITHCTVCGASGLARCSGCKGSGRAACRNCHGTGHFINPATKRSNQCKVCGKTGQVACNGCRGTGNVDCNGCTGSGHVLAWLTLQGSEQTVVSIVPESPIVVAHRVLREERILEPAEISDFAVAVDARERGPLRLEALAEPDRAVVANQLKALDARLERVHSQQYMKLVIPRRDVSYEMCGMSGTLVLSGHHLAGSTTPAAVGPVKRRLRVWAALVILLGVVGTGLRATIGSTAYFDSPRLLATLAAVLTVLIAIPVMGIVLRSWRGGLRFRKLSPPVLVGLAGIVVALGAIPILGAVTRPSAGEVRAALAVGDTQRARVVVDALSEAKASEANELGDTVALAEAGKVNGDARLKILDAVAAHTGHAATEAAASARADRLAQVRQLIDAKNPAAALTTIDKWLPGSDPLVAEERARAHDVARAACTTAPCRFAEAGSANTARSTPARASEVDVARAGVVDALAQGHADSKDVLTRLQQLRALADTGAQTIKSAGSDADLTKRAKDATTWAEAERAKVPLLNASLGVVEELLGPSSRNEQDVPMIGLGGTTVYVALDGTKKRSVGLYVLGDRTAGHGLTSADWPPERILSQSLGRPAAIHKSGQDATGTTRWYDAGVAVIARWKAAAGGQSLLELRIGDATP